MRPTAHAVAYPPAAIEIADVARGGVAVEWMPMATARVRRRAGLRVRRHGRRLRKAIGPPLPSMFGSAGYAEAWRAPQNAGSQVKLRHLPLASGAVLVALRPR